MDVNINLGPVYNDVIGQKKLTVNLSGSETTVRRIMATLFDLFPNFKKELSEVNLLEGNMPYAIFMVNEQFVEIDSPIYDGAEINMFIPITGG